MHTKKYFAFSRLLLDPLAIGGSPSPCPHSLPLPLPSRLPWLAGPPPPPLTHPLLILTFLTSPPPRRPPPPLPPPPGPPQRSPPLTSRPGSLLSGTARQHIIRQTPDPPLPGQPPGPQTNPPPPRPPGLVRLPFRPAQAGAGRRKAPPWPPVASRGPAQAGWCP